MPCLAILLSILFASSAFAQGNRDTGGNRPFRSDNKALVVEDVASAIEGQYWNEEQAIEIAAMLRNTLADGGFDEASTPDELSQQLTTMLHDIDRHFAVNYIGPDAVEQMTVTFEAMETGEESTRDRFAASRMANFGFREVSVLPGNVGYIKLTEFSNIVPAGATATAALDFIANTDAVIFDLRQNGGGHPGMVQFLVSHFLDPLEPTVINTFVSRDKEHPRQLNSLQHLSSAARPDTPLYVLTSGRTGSAAESFSYNLQAMERATIVGQSTAGAANPGGDLLSDFGYTIFVSTGSARSPITGTNWEGIGVIPNIEVDASQALDEALLQAYREIAANTNDEMRQLSLSWAIEEIEYQQSPTTLTDAEAAELVGTYGPRRISAAGGVLSYQRGEQDPVALYPLGEDRFLFGFDSPYRLSFQRNRRGEVVSLSLARADRPPSISTRD